MEMANANLEILAIENILLNPPFEAYETNYKAQVSNTTEAINLLAIPEKEQAVIQVTGMDSLVEGNNRIAILVTAPNGFTKRKYQVEVYKRNLVEEQKYQEEQKLQQKKLEEAYKISELSTNVNQEEYKEIEGQKQKQDLVIGIVIFFAVIVVFVLFVVLKKRKKSQ